MNKNAITIPLISCALAALAGCAATGPTDRVKDLYHQIGTTVTEERLVVINADGSTNRVELTTRRTYNSPLASAVKDAIGIAGKAAP
ncbi:MAG TPA: hypothetical protein PLU30_27250 [Verrucomicrobiae bacterium]|nr:hypothetical protein [Verrucomicrobiae bacterium]